MGDEKSGGQFFRAKLNGVTPVAVKHIRIAERAAPTLADQDLYTKFLNETIISCTTQGPSLLQFYGIFWDASRSGPVLDFYTVSELCVGGDLRGVLYEDPPDDVDPTTSPAAVVAKPRLSNDILRQLLMEILAGVAYLHDNNVVHSDLRPEHVMLLRPLDPVEGVHPGVVKIVDH